MSEKRRRRLRRATGIRGLVPPVLAVSWRVMLGLVASPPAAVASGSVPAVDRVPEPRPRAEWVETYAAKDDRWYRHQDLAACAGGMTLGLLEEDHDPATPPSVRMWVYRVDREGSLLETFEVPKPAAGTPGRPESVALPESMKVECGPEGGTVVAFNFPEGVPWWVHLDPSGAVKSSLRVGGEGSRMKLTDLVREPGGGYLLLGFGPEAAIALHLDADGRVRSEIVRDHGYQDAFVGGCARDGGGWMLVANSLGDDPLAAGEPLVWLSAYDAEGTLEREARFPGRFGALASWSEAGGTLVYDRSTEGRQSIWAVTFDAGLKPAGELEISDEGGTLPSGYVLEPGPEGAQWVLGSRYDHALLAKIDAGGRVAWTHFAEPWGRSLDFRLQVDENGDAYVLFSGFVPTESGFRRKLKLAKVTE